MAADGSNVQRGSAIGHARRAYRRARPAGEDRLTADAEKRKKRPLAVSRTTVGSVVRRMSFQAPTWIEPTFTQQAGCLSAHAVDMPESAED